MMRNSKRQESSVIKAVVKLFFGIILSLMTILLLMPVFIYKYYSESINSGVFIDIDNDLQQMSQNQIFSSFAGTIDYRCVSRTLKESKIDDRTLNFLSSGVFNHIVLSQCMKVKDEDILKHLSKQSSSIQITPDNLLCIKRAFVYDFDLDFFDRRECFEIFKESESRMNQFEELGVIIEDLTCGVFDVQTFNKLFLIEIILTLEQRIPQKLWKTGFEAYKDVTAIIFEEIFSCSIKRTVREWEIDRNFVSIEIQKRLQAPGPKLKLCGTL